MIVTGKNTTLIFPAEIGNVLDQKGKVGHKIGAKQVDKKIGIGIKVPAHKTSSSMEEVKKEEDLTLKVQDSPVVRNDLEVRK